MPMAMPMGVMSAKPSAMRHRRAVEVAGGREAMHVPRARPSKSWWKRITMKSVVRKASEETVRVRPITVEVLVLGGGGQEGGAYVGSGK